MNDVKQTPSYEEELGELRENLKGMLPEDKLDVFDRDAKGLQERHRHILKLYTGDLAPDFTLEDATGTRVRLKDLLAKGRVLLVFYRGAWCPYCNLQLNQYKSLIPELDRLQTTLVAISPQTPDQSLSMKEKNELPYPVLSDPGNVVARQFTTVFRNGDAPVAAMQELGIDFDGFYSDDSRELPVPAVFVIDHDSTVRLAGTAGGDYRNRVETADVLTTLKQQQS